MHQMDRRTFLLATGRWLTVAALAPTAAGCARLLRWSESQGSPVEDSEAVVFSTSTTGDATTTTSAIPGDATTSSQAGNASTTTTAPAAPDLAVFRGDSPGDNVRAAVAQLGGMERFVKRDAKVVVKPNVLTGKPPEYAVNTNPLVIAEIVRMCLEAGAANVTVLDYPTTSPRAAFQNSGLQQATRSPVAPSSTSATATSSASTSPRGVAITSWPLVTDALEADTLINVPIGKTHGMAGLTLSMKNLMGIMGDPRGQIHIDFPQKITDLNTLVKPHLVILDAYRVMVRNGPSGGRLRGHRTAQDLRRRHQPGGHRRLRLRPHGLEAHRPAQSGGGQRPGAGRDRPGQVQHLRGDRLMAGDEPATDRRPEAPSYAGADSIRASRVRARGRRRGIHRYRRLFQIFFLLLFFALLTLTIWPLGTLLLGGFLLADPLLAVNSVANGVLRWEFLLAMPVLLSPLFFGTGLLRLRLPAGIHRSNCSARGANATLAPEHARSCARCPCSGSWWW